MDSARTSRKYLAANDGGASNDTSSYGIATNAVSGGTHTHNIEHTHETNSNGSHTHTINSSGGTEARPINFTSKMWKRIA